MNRAVGESKRLALEQGLSLGLNALASALV